jgi:hypothetical protein
MENNETLEEFIKREGYHDSPTQEIFEDGVRLGAKWQAERMYSEEEVFQMLLNYQTFYPYANNEKGLRYWFEQNKKVII